MKYNLEDTKTTFDLSVENLNRIAEQILKERFVMLPKYAISITSLGTSTIAHVWFGNGIIDFNIKYKNRSIKGVGTTMAHELAHTIAYHTAGLKPGDGTREFQGLCIAGGGSPNYYEKQSYWTSKSWLYTDTYQIGQLTNETRTQVLKRIAKSIGIETISWKDIRPGISSIGQWGHEDYDKGRKLKTAIAYELYVLRGDIKDWKHKFE